MQVLVTGGAGFLGSRVLQRLTEKAVKCRVLDVHGGDLRSEIAGRLRDTGAWHVGDIRSSENVCRAVQGCDVIVHLAALLTPDCQQDPLRGAQVNLIGTLNIFEAARRQGATKVVYLSSAGVFGPDDGTNPRPTTHYGAFKLACEGSARAYWEADRLSSVGLRPSIIYGPGRETGLSAGISLACKAAVAGARYTIGFSGAADFVYVEDVVDAIEAALSSNHQGAHVATVLGEQSTVEHAVSLIQKFEPGSRIDIRGKPIPFTSSIASDPSDPITSGSARTSFAEGIAATIRHYRTARGAGRAGDEVPVLVAVSHERRARS